MRLNPRSAAALFACSRLLRVVRRHQGALDAAKQALAWLRKGLSAVSREEDGEEEQPESRYSQRPGDCCRGHAPETCERFACRRERADLAAMLAMTLHNAAVQHEHLEQWKHALAVRQSHFSASCLLLARY